MATRPFYRDQEAPAPQTLGDRHIGASSVEHKVGRYSFAPMRDSIKVAHTPQIAFTLLADVAGKKKVTRKRDTTAFERRCDGQETHHSGSVVARPRRGQAILLQNWGNRGADRKYRIDVCRQHHTLLAGPRRIARIVPQNIPLRVNLHLLQLQ